MKVSVLIPTYNRREYVVNAIQSVIDQDYADMEIIVVDDGSTDDTAAALEPYLSRIRFIRTTNQGPALARNVAMRAAKGDYLAYLDSDDLYYPFKIKLQALLLDSYPDVGMVYSEFSAFSDQGFWDELHLKKYHTSAYERGRNDYQQLFTERAPLSALISCGGIDNLQVKKWADNSVYFGEIFEAYLFDTVVFTNSMMFRRSLLDRVGLQQSRFGMFHDLEFALRLCKEAKVAFMDVPTYKLRYHLDQISTTQGPQGGKVAVKIQRDLLRVARCHMRRDLNFYFRNEGRVHRQLAKLCRATAIPLLSYDAGTPHERKYYPIRARRYLKKSREYGQPELLLYALTFSPSIVRRVAFKLMSLRRARGTHKVS